MKIVMLSNFLNHHQLPLAQALVQSLDEAYRFIATQPMEPERTALGYEDLNGRYPFVLPAYETGREEVVRLLRESDVVIVGSTPEDLAQLPIRDGKLTFRWAERPLRRGLEPLKYLPRLLRWHWRNPRKKPVYLLCAGGYTAGDYRRFGLFHRRAYRWGYFPETRRYESEEVLLAAKDPARLLWVGRLIDLKHPEQAIEVARRLKERGYRFRMDLIGRGELEGPLRDQIRDTGLEDVVTLLGPMSPDAVRDHMERAGIFLFTSDRQEGWGAVVNEAMNSGCALVAGEGAGSLPYLLRDGENGILCPSGDVDSMTQAVADLLDHPERQKTLGREAYRTITSLWNAEVAAQRLLELSRRLLEGEAWPDLYPDGPCSREDGRENGP